MHIAFLQQQWLRLRVSVIQYTNFACLLESVLCVFCLRVPEQVSGHATLFVRAAKQFDCRMSDGC
jgi:hypothetical protein